MHEFSYKRIQSIFINTNDILVTLMQNKFILVLDDDGNIVTVVARSLRKQGLNVHAFTDPVAALEYFKQNFKDCVLVISDIRMPRMNGFQFVREAWELRPDLKVIFMTAFEINISEFKKIHPSMEVYALIKKPILMPRLETLIKNSMSGTATMGKNEEADKISLGKSSIPS
jgi:DNA-binding NtrC family response regulator